jgi:carbamoyltransferase
MFLLSQSTHRMLVRYHPLIGHLYVPNLKARLPTETGGYFAVTNSLGFRADFEFVESKRGAPRILMFGDSYTAGDNCVNSDRYSDQLACMLDVEVYNYGLSGSGIDQQLLIYREFARNVERDLILICVQIDSVRRIQMSHRESIDRLSRQRLLVPKPYFTLAGGDLVLHNVPVPRERPVAGSIDPDVSPASRSLDGWKEAALRLYSTSPYFRGLRKRTRGHLLRLKSEVYRRSGIQPYPEFRSEHSVGWTLMRAILDEFIREVAPTPVVIVPIPTLEYFSQGVEPIYQTLFAQMEDPARGVHVLDVSRPLISEPWKTRRKYSFRLDPHFTPFANEKVARMMADCIDGRRLLPARPKKPLISATVRSDRKQNSSHILGISCFYHNSAAALIRDGEIVAAAEEERFTRIKNDRRFPHQAINYCLEEGGVDPSDLAAVVYYENPSLVFERILYTELAVGELAEESWLRVMPSWVRYKLHIPQLIRNYLKYDGLILQDLHHRSHAASAFYPSPYDRAAILTIDAVGEWATASVGVGRGSQLKLLQEMHFPHSLGLLYSAFTQFIGFKVNSGEYKMMGLAPYGEPTYTDLILDKLVHLKDDGSIELHLEYFAFLDKLSMTNERFAELFGGPPRQPDSRITRREIDMARSIQFVTEEAMLRMARHAQRLTGEKKLCLAGGVALNCVGNGRLLREGPFDDIWIQPAAGDAGCALGAALDTYHTYFGKERVPSVDGRPLQGGSYWGPSFSEAEIGSYLDSYNYPHHRMHDSERSDFLAQCLKQGKVVGHFSGRLEYGPRSLGARSILGDARSEEMQADLNMKIKYRESFRPFAPSVLVEKVGDYFDLDRASPYMLIVAPVREDRRKPSEAVEGDDLLSMVRQARSDISAVTHVDYSARIHTVAREDHPVYYDLIHRFEQQTGCAVIVNTSFNVRGEPIVCTPGDAYRCFMRTEMNVLALGNCVLLKEEQPAWHENKAEALESEHVTKKEGSNHPKELVCALRKLFRCRFAAIAASLRQQHAVLVDRTFRRSISEWTTADESQPVKELFEFPEALDTSAPDCKAFARASTERWKHGPAREALLPLVEELVELGFQHPAKEALEEDVSESVYVMF